MLFSLTKIDIVTAGAHPFLTAGLKTTVNGLFLAVNGFGQS